MLHLEWIDYLGLAQAALSMIILGWLVADDAYDQSPKFRRLWDRTRLPFPHTSFSRFWRG
jgi:hypothetical protein